MVAKKGLHFFRWIFRLPKKVRGHPILPEKLILLDGIILF